MFLLVLVFIYYRKLNFDAIVVSWYLNWYFSHKLFVELSVFCLHWLVAKNIGRQLKLRQHDNLTKYSYRK